MSTKTTERDWDRAKYLLDNGCTTDELAEEFAAVRKEERRRAAKIVAVYPVGERLELHLDTADAVATRDDEMAKRIRSNEP